MTKEQAIEELREDIALYDNEIVRLSTSVGTPDRNLIDALEIAIECVKKQIPKKPIPFTECWSEEIFYKCPLCGDDWNMNEYGNGIEHCWTCGQAISWEVE